MNTHNLITREEIEAEKALRDIHNWMVINGLSSEDPRVTAMMASEAKRLGCNGKIQKSENGIMLAHFSSEKWRVFIDIPK